MDKNITFSFKVSATSRYCTYRESEVVIQIYRMHQQNPDKSFLKTYLFSKNFNLQKQFFIRHSRDPYGVLLINIIPFRCDYCLNPLAKARARSLQLFFVQIHKCWLNSGLEGCHVGVFGLVRHLFNNTPNVIIRQGV